MNEYQQAGYKNRRHYLQELAREWTIDEQTVFSLASMLGPSEDFDGLVTALEDEMLEREAPFRTADVPIDF